MRACNDTKRAANRAVVRERQRGAEGVGKRERNGGSGVAEREGGRERVTENDTT